MLKIKNNIYLSERCNELNKTIETLLDFRK